MKKFNFKLDSGDSLTNTTKKRKNPEIRKKIVQTKKRILFDVPNDDVGDGSFRRSTLRDDGKITFELIVKKREKPPITDFQELANRLLKLTDYTFVYLTYSVPKTSEFFTPYSLIEVPYEKINNTMFYTMSQCGVTYWSNTENQFTKLNEWLKEYTIYCDIMKIKLFSNFRLWKGFKVWQKCVQWKKYINARNFLSENLFILTPTLAKAIIYLREKYCQFIEMTFVDCTIMENWHLFNFIEAQMIVYEKSRAMLIDYRKEAINVLYEACYNAIVAKGFHAEDEALIYTTMKKLKEMMTYTDRIRKRRYLILITRFLNYCDHMTISFLHIMLHKTFDQLSEIFRKHDALGPIMEMLETSSLNIQIEGDRPLGMPQVPLFLGDLVLKPDRVEIDPSRDVTIFIMNQFIDQILTTIYSIERFQSDSFFNRFTEPSIMGKQEDRLCGIPPDIYLVMNNDRLMIENREFIFNAINWAYDKAEIYVERFDQIREDYQRDVNTDPESIRAENDLTQLRLYCERYYKEMDALEGILPVIKLGLLQLEQNTFKEEVIPVCLELLKVLEVHLPKIAIEAVKILYDKAEDIMIKLKTPPIASLDFVLYMRYLVNCECQIDKLIQEIDYVYQCFTLMKDYKIFVDECEKVKYMDCEDLILQCKEVRNSQMDKKPEFVQQLSDCLQRDIQKLFYEIEDIRSETTKAWLIDSTSNPVDVKENLNNFMERLAVCQSQADDYRSYQKEFKIDTTRYDSLEEVLQEVRLRQTLWNSLEEWATSIEKWHNQYFHNLDMEELISINSKILKNCTLLEKNLPTNQILPKLRNEAEAFKFKLPVLGYLRNATLKPRHWLRIETILAKKVYLDDSITLNTFIESDAFQEEISDGIMEISGQASAEQGLELILKKVDNLWKEMELSIVLHRDAKDVYILAGIDELQLALDETNVNINTIAASRHVGPIKSRVEEWQRLLDRFADTLEEWLACQTAWIYLEAIFSAPDIQRQLPNEARMFLVVDKSWKDIMRKVQKLPWALPAMTDIKTLELMKRNNVLLDQIQRCLEAYLELKRVAFPRFYFLSNDELLEILAQTRNPHAVQPHLRKCFDAIAKLQFAVKEGGKGEPPILLNDILAIVSPEDEKIMLGMGLKARGPVEDWLGKVEDAMFIALKRYMKFAYQCYSTKDRSEWFQEHPNQIVLTVSQQQWASQVHAILDDKNSDDLGVHNNLKEFEQTLFVNLQNLAAIARSDIDKLLRKVLCALITIDVHARDTISNMVKNKVGKSTDFEWLKMLRYYWIPSTQTMEAKMSSANLPYFYEYLGAGGVLVITPLTDRCYLCLMGALQIDLGGAPAGPAGTGKTETTKDLAKALAKQCVVFNCSEGLDYKIMGRFFSGLAQSGAWCCFDEFNRIDIEVLSVIAQQLITIKNAKSARLKRFIFEGNEIKLNMSCATFITMNPGYAGRTELPDNLKALFRPIAMMVPDYALIAEVILYSEGFENSKVLARKMVQMYKLCSEQLSQQDHYDFGMRAVKSVLVMAGALKRAAPEQHEDHTLISALRDSNLPKFLSDDAQLFMGILNDLFPGVELKKAQHIQLQGAIEQYMEQQNLQLVPELIVKCIQLYETMCVRWGVMLVGPTGGGKTTILHTLANALSRLGEDKESANNDVNFRLVKIQTLNPKSISLDELYGAVNSTTLEWKDGLLGLAVRMAVTASEQENDHRHQWIVCDGPVDAVWIENLNTVLDDNKMLCLANSERIKLTQWIHMIFEVEDLSQASPATVSRCGMVYIDSNELGWRPLVKSWCNTLSNKPSFSSSSSSTFNTPISNELCQFIQKELFDVYFKECLKYVRNNCKYAIHQVECSKVTIMCTLLRTLMYEIHGFHTINIDACKNVLLKLFIWAMLWAIGGNLIDSSKLLFQEFLRNTFQNNENASLPNDDLWKYKINLETFKWEDWSKSVIKFQFKSEMSFFDMLIPTTDTSKYGYITELLFRENQSVMLTGDTGVGKSILAKAVLSKLSERDIVPVFLNFSAQTTSLRTQEMIESRLEKRRRTVLGAPIGKKLIIFVDDVNMPKLDTYGSQPPIELLRQFLDFKGFYDRNKMFWKDICDVALGCAGAPPGGGRNPLTPRFVRHFALLNLPLPNTDTLTTIFSSILTGFFDDFNSSIRPLALPIVNAGVDMYNRIAQELLPTPTKSHYVFNLRDLSKCMQGILQADSSNYSQPLQCLRLFYHESMRVFHDRLVNTDDKMYFKNLIKDICITYFDSPIVKSDDECILFGDFILFGQSKENRIYEEIYDTDKLKSVLFDYIDDYNTLTGKEMQLILFQDAIEHIIRLTRLLRAERGNGLLVGVSGMGKQSLSQISAHINGYKCARIELTRNYDQSTFHEDLQKLYHTAGVLNNPTVFVITDTQIVKEEFLEDINNMLNSGEVPNLYEGDDFEKLILEAHYPCTIAKWEDTSRDGIYNFVISRVRANLHIIICMSPVGDAFRRRCRMFPSLVNCCTIDWFVKWPSEALHSVALVSLKDVSVNEQQNTDLATICVRMHESIELMSEQFLNEYHRYYYTTPSSYLELLKLYHSLLQNRTDIIIAKRNRISNGLNKILETNDIVAVMQNELTVLFPMLEIQSNEMKTLLDTLAADNKVADSFKHRVLQDESDAHEKEIIARAVADEANKDLEVARPNLIEAQDALKAISKSDINELRSFAAPAALVQFVMESVCVLFGVKPSWDSAKKLMADVNFVKKLMEFDKENISEITLRKLKTYIEHKDFDPVKIEKVSKVAKSVSLWVIAMDKYAKVYKIVEPKIKKSREAANELKQIMAILKQKQSELAEVEAQIQSLKDNIDEKQREFQVIQDNVNLTTSRLNRAGRLTSALSDEEVRWSETIKLLAEELWAIPGDVLIASACVAYLGAFPTNYRKTLIDMWITDCHKYEIPSSKEFNLVSVLGDPYQIRHWNMNYLPRDIISIENGIIVTNALRWPLMIDPQEQANRWIRSIEEKNNLNIIKMNDSNILRILELCIRQGHPLLIEDVEETLDPTLAPVLGRAVYSQAGRLLIKLGDTEIDYDNNFKLYMTTKLSNPHYLPEICITVTLVNFLVTESGLEDQLLSYIVAIELPELEKQRSDLIERINSDKQQLLQLEDKVLKLLHSSEGNILDDEELVETLNESKETSVIIAARLCDTEETEAVITEQREKYRILANRGAIIYFVVASLSEIDPMYQYSLKYFLSIFCNVLKMEHEKVALEERLKRLLNDEIYAIYLNVSRGLFEKHKLIFSFSLAVALGRQQGGTITESEYSFLLHGALNITTNGATKPKPININLSDMAWNNCIYLELEYKEFEYLTMDLGGEINIELNDYNENFSFGNKMSTTKASSKKNWNQILNDFQKLLLIKAVAEQNLVLAIGSYVRKTLGNHFTTIDGNSNSLSVLFTDTSCTTPLIFILSTGSDPMSNFLRFANERNYTEKLQTISLGQGQGPAAEHLIEKGRLLGHWIFLQNCHLATSWMPRMETIIRNISLGVTKTHTDFRLYLSSMPTKAFPISVLQNSVKFTNEPPKGLKANLTRALDDLSSNYFEIHALGTKWCSMVFGLCLFHSVLLERRKFGALGWNIMYEFNESDRECGLKTLDMYCKRESIEPIPWDALEYINGEITWGGRVTDYWDQRCLRTILRIFSSEQILSDNYQYSESGQYKCPKSTQLIAFKEYVSNDLPFNESPDIFGMHENANLVFKTKETKFFIRTLLQGQSIIPSDSVAVGANAGLSNDERILQMIDKIRSRLPMNIDVDKPYTDLFKRDDKGRIPSLSTVLLQEIERYNKLLQITHESLMNLQKAIKGLVVMSENLEKIFLALMNNQVPMLWSSRGFLSTKTLSNWIVDFQYRIDYIQTWMNKGLPKSSWLSGLFFPQTFLTGILQTHARRFNLPIDSLRIDFEIQLQTILQSNVYKHHLDNSSKTEEQNSKIYSGIEHPEIGVIVHGLFIEAGRWDPMGGGLCDSKPGELTSHLPAIWFKPCIELNIGNRYEAPLYKTQVRAGVLSTTGHSTNFVLSVLLDSKKSADFWILRGTALVTGITE